MCLCRPLTRQQLEAITKEVTICPLQHLLERVVRKLGVASCRLLSCKSAFKVLAFASRPLFCTGGRAKRHSIEEAELETNGIQVRFRHYFYATRKDAMKTAIDYSVLTSPDPFCHTMLHLKLRRERATACSSDAVSVQNSTTFTGRGQDLSFCLFWNWRIRRAHLTWSSSPGDPFFPHLACQGSPRAARVCRCLLPRPQPLLHCCTVQLAGRGG